MSAKLELRRLINLNIQHTLADKNALEMLKSFLQKRSNGDKSLIELYIELFEKCSTYLKQSPEITKEQLEELCDMGLPYDIETGKLNMISRGDAKTCARLILEEVCKKIETQQEYEEFRNDLLKQYEKC